MLRMAKNVNNGRQNTASFISYFIFYFSDEANNKTDQPMLGKLRASNSRVFIGDLSKFSKLK